MTNRYNTMRTLLMLSLFASLLTTSTDAQAQSSSTGEVIIVKMIAKSSTEWRYEPSNITARPGDLIRFVQEDIMPHNVQFTSTPKGADLADIAMGPFLLAKGDTYELDIDARFLKGVYNFVCTPHAQMGMTGTLTVASSRTATTK